MPERGAPFEDGPPLASSRPVVDPTPVEGSTTEGASAGDPQAGRPTSPAGGPQPGSPEEAAVLAVVFGDGAGASVARAERRRRNLAVMTFFILIAAVVVLVLGANYLRHVATTTSTSAPGGSPAHSESEQNLLTAAGAVTNYETSHTLTTAGLTASLTTADPSLSFTLVSGSPTQVSVAVPVPGAVVLTSFQPSPAACVGVLQVVSDQSAPIFSADPATADRGTYYFEAQASSGLCNALTVTPPASNAISAQGFPTARLP